MVLKILIDFRYLESQQLIFYNYKPYEYYQLVSIIGAIGSSSAFTSIIIERCIASIRLKSYEKERHPRIMFCLITFVIASSIYLGYYLFTCKFLFFAIKFVINFS